MTNIIDYKIEIGDSISQLETRVKRNINNGWQPFSELKTISSKDKIMLTQTMVKYK